MTAQLKRPVNALDVVMLCSRLLILFVGLLTFMPGAAHASDTSTQVAVNTTEIDHLKGATSSLSTEVTALQERVSNIEGFGKGLVFLTGAQLFVQIFSHVSVQRKRS